MTPFSPLFAWLSAGNVANQAYCIIAPQSRAARYGDNISGNDNQY